MTTVGNPFHYSEWPKRIIHPDEYQGGERLLISYDLGITPMAEQKQAIKAWLKRLPELHQVRRLSIWSHVTQPILEAASQLKELECLQIKWTNVRSIVPLQQLASLRYLYVGSSTKVESIDPLAALSTLEVLELENFKCVNDFSPLLRLPRLQSLALPGSMWARQDVGPLEVFSKMTSLKSLALDTKHVASLRPLGTLVNLATLDIGGRLPMEEYAWLAAKLPTTECQWFHPYLDLKSSGIGRCPKCKEETRVMLTGRGAGTRCRQCDKSKVERHVQAFETAKRAAAVA